MKHWKFKPVDGQSGRWNFAVWALMSVFGLLMLQSPNAQAGLTAIHSFDGTGGSYPSAGLVQGNDGAFYGTTSYGGVNNIGTVFKLRADGSNFIVLYSLASAEGSYPDAGLVQGSDGAFYGTTTSGGTSGAGTVFKLQADGSRFTVLHQFTGSDGYSPKAGLVQGSDGAFYGTTYGDGSNNYGTVFKLRADGSGFSVLHRFNSAKARNPEAALVQGRDGSLYGTTYFGGSSRCNNGAVFKLQTDGSGFTILHQFDCTQASGPYAGLVQGSDGAFYGTTIIGGSGGDGTIFKLNADGSGFTVLHQFDGADGENPYTALVHGSDGAFYGTTNGGGASNDGVLFKLNADGSGFTVLHSFDGTDGSLPAGGLTQGSDGAFYGTTVEGGDGDIGTVFKFVPNIDLPAKLAYGNVSRFDQRILKATAKIVNNAVSFTAASLSGVNAVDFAITGDNCTGKTIAVNKTCAISVRFVPGQVVDTIEGATLTLEDSAGSQIVLLNGTSADLTTVNPSQMQFGKVTANTTSAPKKLTLTNNTSAAISVNDRINGFAISADTCQGVMLAAFKSCMVWVTYTPASATSNNTGTLSLTDSADAGYAIRLSGKGK